MPPGKWPKHFLALQLALPQDRGETADDGLFELDNDLIAEYRGQSIACSVDRMQIEPFPSFQMQFVAKAADQ